MYFIESNSFLFLIDKEFQQVSGDEVCLCVCVCMGDELVWFQWPISGLLTLAATASELNCLDSIIPNLL